MTIDDKLKKECWVRRVPIDSKARSTAWSEGYQQRVSTGVGFRYLNLTQDDLMNEIDPNAHEVNSQFFSRRPIYGPTGEKDENGNVKWKIVDYDEVESVSLGLQHTISVKKASHFAANGFWVANETTDNNRYDTLMSYKDTVGLNDAYMEAITDCFQTGDSAIYLYIRGNAIEYEVFSKRKGDTLYPDTDEKGNPMMYRKYMLKGKRAVDIFTTDKVETWVQSDDEMKGTWFERFLSRINTETTEDGYKLLSRRQAQLSSDMLQVYYFRIDDIPSGPAEDSICALERALSFMAEEVKNSAFPILFLKSQSVVNLPPSDINGKAIGVKGTAETLAHSDAKFLAPPDASNINTTYLNNLAENITRTTMSVFVEPKIFSSGADSSTSIKILFQPEIAWCQTKWPMFAKTVRRMMEGFKMLVGKLEGDVIGYGEMRLSVGPNIWIPSNRKEEIDNVMTQVYGRVMSRKAAIFELENQHIGDFEEIQKEWEEEITMKAEIPARYNKSASVEDENNPMNKPKDKNALGRTIEEA